MASAKVGAFFLLFLCVVFRKFEAGVVMADNNELKGALKECVRCFPKFYNDFDVLLSEGICKLNATRIEFNLKTLK